MKKLKNNSACIELFFRMVIVVEKKNDAIGRSQLRRSIKSIYGSRLVHGASFFYRLLRLDEGECSIGVFSHQNHTV